MCQNFDKKTRGLAHQQLGERRQFIGMQTPARENLVYAPAEGGLLALAHASVLSVELLRAELGY